MRIDTQRKRCQNRAKGIELNIYGYVVYHTHSRFPLFFQTTFSLGLAPSLSPEKKRITRVRGAREGAVRQRLLRPKHILPAVSTPPCTPCEPYA